MTHRRAQMVSALTGQPLDPHWQPCLELEELETANTLLQQRHLTYHWRWLPQTLDLRGAAELVMHS
ncbi:MAG: hypothetical protein RLZZ515_2560 [Cyanobacteriota bacterium]